MSADSAEDASNASNDAVDGAVQGQNVSDEKVRQATGRVRDEWHALLDDADARDWTHAAIARWLVAEHHVDGWWAQGITVGYEHARGTRVPGQQADGTFSVSATKTLRAPKAAVLQAVIETIGVDLGEPYATSPDAKYATARWVDDASGERVLASVSQQKRDRVLVALDRSRMSEPATAQAKDRLRTWLDTVAAVLE